MRKRFLVILANLVGVFALSILLTAPASAHATMSKHSFDIAGCQRLELTLHGHNQPTSRCLTTSKGAQPLSTVPCGNDGNVLTLYWNSLRNPPAPGNIPPGAILCIRGQGYVDLSGTAWNDQASAWWAGCSSGHFDTNAGVYAGKQQYFGGGSGASAPSGNFDGAGNHLANDSLTVVTLDSSC